MKRSSFVVCFLLLISALFGENKPISFSADTMIGSAGKKNAVTVLEGNAEVVVGSLRISGDRIELSGKDYRLVVATGHVTGSDEDKGFSFTSDELSYDRDREVASFRGNAKLSDTKNEVEATASIISYNQKTETAFFQIDVTLKRRKIQCTAAFALYRRTLSLLDLSGSPSVIRDGDEFKADRIGVNLDTENITLDGSVSGNLKDAASTGDEPTDGKEGTPPSPPDATDGKSGTPSGIPGGPTSSDGASSSTSGSASGSGSAGRGGACK